MEQKTSARAAILIGSICIFGYGASYIAKNIISALQLQIAADGFFDYAVLGSMGTAFLLAYGVGQLINGFMGDHVSPRLMVFFGIALSGVSVLSFPFLHNATAAIGLWGVCGLACSMLGGPMTALIGNSTSERVGRLLLTLLLVAGIVGSLVAYLLALVGAISGSWRIGFFVGGGTTLAAATVWYVVCLALEKRGVIARHQPAPTADKEAARKARRAHLAAFFNFGFAMMLVVTMTCGVLRNAISLWIPTVLTEYLQFTPRLSATVSTGLPIVNFAGTFLSLWLLVLFRNSEKRLSMALFLLAGGGFAVTMLTGRHNGVLATVALFLACAAVNGIYNLIFSVYVLRFKSVGGISGFAGVIDAASYLAAALANLAFTALSQQASWGTMMLSCIVLCAVGSGMALFSSLSKKDVT